MKDDKKTPQNLTPEELRRLEYAGGGYFRIPAPKYKKSPTFHAPELIRALADRLEG